MYSSLPAGIILFRNISGLGFAENGEFSAISGDFERQVRQGIWCRFSHRIHCYGEV
jgi:hypothetical protein